MLPATHTVPGGSLCLAVTKHVLTAQCVTGQGVVLAMRALTEVHLSVVACQVRGCDGAVANLLQLSQFIVTNQILDPY